MRELRFRSTSVTSFPIMRRHVLKTIFTLFEVPPLSSSSIFFPNLRRHVLNIMVTFCVVMGMAVFYTAISPVLYTSEAKLFVRLGAKPWRYPTATTNQTVNLQETRENELNSIYELLKSRAMIEQLVDTFGIDAVLDKSTGASSADPERAVPETPGTVSIWTQLNPLTTYSRRDKAIRKLSQRLQVDPVRKSNIINISCDATDPPAQKLVSTAIELARTTHIRVNRTVGSFDFFDAEAKDKAQHLAELEEAGVS